MQHPETIDNQDDKTSLTLWLPKHVVENLNELVVRRSGRKKIANKSSVISDLVNEAHRLTARRVK